MTKADDLWEKYGPPKDPNSALYAQGKIKFLAALAEYGELVKAEAVKVCEKLPFVEAMPGCYRRADNEDCAAAIEKMKLP